MQQRTFPFHQRSVMLFATLALGAAAAFHAHAAPGAEVNTVIGPAPAAHTAPSKFSAGPDGPSPSATRAAFDRADANHDGKLSAKEAATLPAIGNRFEALDKNKDGFLSHEEFERGV